MQLTLYYNKGESIRIQKDQMNLLKEKIRNSNNKKLYIKANTIANKAVKIKFGLEKTIPKKDMTEEMLKFRTKMLSKIVNLLIDQDRGEIEHISPKVFNDI